MRGLMADKDYEIIMKFGPKIMGSLQAKLMFDLEKNLRETTGLPIEVFKETMADDSKLRNLMTEEERKRI
jgi:hypothetical protein